MSAPFERGVLISAPARELARTTPPSSVFPLQALDVASLSVSLRDAIDLVATCAPPSQPRLIVARPEMFTDGATLAWLNQAIGGVLDHVALSDGETVRLVPGLRNHVYFYSLGQIGRLEALERLERRAPELFTQLHSQINTALAFRCKGRRFAPMTQAIVADAPAADPETVLRPFALDRRSREQSAAASSTAPARFERLRYLRLSECALREAAVARRVSACVAEACADPSRALVWILPESESDDASRVDALVQCLLAGGGRLPGGLMSNVFFTSGDLDAETLARLAVKRALITDALADFSRAAPEFPESFADIVVFARSGRHMPVQVHELLRMVYGPQTQIEWLRGHEPARRP
jgi:hypothetical protein